MIVTTLKTKINELCSQYPERYPVPIHVLEAVDHTIGQQWPQRLNEAERKYHGKRLLLIPYQWENSHWIGVFVKFDSDERMNYAEFIDPLTPSNFNPEILQEEISRRYPTVTLQRRVALQHIDENKSAILTIENLLESVELAEEEEKTHFISIKQNFQFSPPITKIQPSNQVRPSMKEQRSVGAHQRRQQFRSCRSTAFTNDFDGISQDVSSPIERRKNIESLQKKKRSLFASVRRESLFEIEQLQSNIQEVSSSSSATATGTMTDEMNDECLNVVYEDWRSVPPCAEQSILRLLLYISVQVKSRTALAASSIELLSPAETVIENEIESFRERLKVEELFVSDIEKLWSSLSIYVKHRQWRMALEAVRNLIKQLNPIDPHELFRLVRKVDEAAESIRGQSILLFLGSTGTGKSTTIQFLGGSKMIEETVRGLNHIAPREIQNNQLRQIKSSPFSRAETRYITPVSINLRDLGGGRDQPVILCDSPGFQDTMGPEVDIANGVGIVKAIRKCTSVRLIILISYKSMGDRCGGIANLAQTLVRLVPNIKDYLKSFSYVFTRFPREKPNSLHAELKDLYEKIRQDDTVDESLCVLLGDIVQKTKTSPIILDPLTNDPIDILETLLESTSIEHPEEVFKHFLTHRSESFLREHIGKCQMSIVLATKRNDYPLIEHKLYQMKEFIDRLDQNFIKDIYKHCLQELTSHFSEEFNRETTNFRSQLINSNILTDEEIRSFYFAIERAELAENLMKKRLKENVVQSHMYYEYLDKQIEQLSDEIKDKEIDDSSVGIILNQLKSICKVFSKYETQYETLRQIFRKKIDSIPEVFAVSVENAQFEQSVKTFEKLERVTMIFKDQFDQNSLNNISEQLKESFLQHLRQSTTPLKQLLVQDTLNPQDFRILHDCVQQLETVLNMFSLQLFVSRTSIDEIYQFVLNEILLFYQKISNRINDELEKKSPFEIFESLMNQIDLLREIPTVQHKIDQSFYNLLEKLIGRVQKLKNDFESLWEKFIRDTSEKLSGNELFRSISLLDQTKWIEKYRKDFVLNLMNSIREQILTFVDETEKFFLKTPIDLNNQNRIGFVIVKLDRIEELRKLENLIPELRSKIDEIHHWFENLTDEICVRIRTEFDVKNFNEVDFDRGEKAFRFVESFENIQKFSLLKEHLEDFFRLFAGFLNDEMEKLFQKITNDEILTVSKLLKDRLVQMREISTKYSKIFSCFPNRKLLDDWKNRFAFFSIDLSDDFKRFLLIKQMEKVHSCWFIAKCLRKVDEFLDKEIYSNLSNKFQESFYKQTKETSLSLAQFIENGEYEKIPFEMFALQTSDRVSSFYFDEAKKTLNRSLEKLVEDAEIQTNSLQIPLNRNEIESLMRILGKFRKVKIHLIDFVDSIDKFEQCEKEVKFAIENHLTIWFEQIAKLFHNGRFLGGENQLKEIDSIRLILVSSNCSSIMTREISLFKENLDVLRQKETIEKFSKQNLKDFLDFPPSEIFDELKKVATIDPTYEVLLKTFEKLIYEKFDDELEKIKNEPIRTQNFRQIELAAKFLPDRIRVVVEMKLKHCREDLKQIEENEETNFQRFLRTDDLEAMKSFLLEHQNQKSFDQILKKLGTIFLRMTDAFRCSNVDDALNDAKIIFDYRETFGEIVKDVETVNCSMISKVENVFHEAFRCVLEQFFQNSHRTMSNEILVMIEENFLCLIEFVRFEKKTNLIEILPADFYEKMTIFNDQIVKYLTERQTNYVNALEKFDAQLLDESLTMIELCEPFWIKLKTRCFFYELENLSICSFRTKSFVEILESISDRLEILLDEEKNAEENFENYYRRIDEKRKFLSQLHFLDKFSLRTKIVDVEKQFNESIEQRIRHLVEQLDKFIDMLSSECVVSEQNCHNFHLGFLHLRAISSDLVDPLVKKLFDRICEWKNEIDAFEDITTILINLKRMSNIIFLFQSRFDENLDEILHEFRRKTSNSVEFWELIVALDEESTGLGQMIVSEFRIFDGYFLSLFNKKEDRQGIDFVLQQFDDQSEELRDKYEEFRTIYGDVLKRNLKTNYSLENLISNVKRSEKSEIVKIAALISALWTLQNVEHFIDAEGLIDRETYLLQPHPGQVIAMFSLLNLDDKTKKFVQMSSGDGKSLVIGLTACVYAILGFEVFCACKNVRKFSSMRNLFESLDLTNFIHFDTLNRCFELVADGRTFESNEIENLITENGKKSRREKILLIEDFQEVFDERFFTLRSNVTDSMIENLIDFVTREKQSNFNLKKIQETREYQICLSRFHGWETLIEQATRDFVEELNDKKEKSFLRIKFGCASTVELIREFRFIFGLSESFEVLNDREKRCLAERFHIDRFVVIPRIFGTKKFEFRSNVDVKIETNSNYFRSIQNEIDENVHIQRPVLVVFETKEKLEEFYYSNVFLRSQFSVGFLTENLTSVEEKIAIRRAVAPGRVTLCTRSFGKGTDFMNYSSVVIDNGGLHVIQTFFSSNIFEEIQIQNRTARQSDSGSFSLVLLDDDLRTFGFEQTTNSAFQSFLDENRQKLCERKLTSKFQPSKSRPTDLDELKTFLIEQNRPDDRFSLSRIVFLIDGTRSMGKALQQCFDTVEPFFEKVRTILNENNHTFDSFEMQIVIYRNYDCPADEILQFSSWECRERSLTSFLKTIEIDGGLGNEAIELAFCHVNQENEMKPVSQVILIGDAPPNTRVEISKKRQQIGEDYWKTTRFAQKTFYEDELEKIIASEIPIYTFFVKNQAEESFRNISKKTGGRCQQFDAQLLIDVVIEIVLKNIYEHRKRFL